jgi:hypothetical protein
VSDIEASIDPVPVLLEPGEISPVNKSVAAGLVGLEYLARQAFEEKRRKQCLEITHRILKLEPDHVEARTIQTSVRSDLDRDLASAQSAVKDAQFRKDPELYKRAASILRRIVEADPENLEAQTLLHETVAESYFRPSPERPRWKVNRRTIILGVIAVVAFAAAFAFTKSRFPVSAPLAAEPVTFSNVEAGSSSTASVISQADVDLYVGWPADTRNLVPVVLRSAPVIPTATLQPPRASAPAPNRIVQPGGSTGLPGYLAISSVLPLEIYRGEEHVGSTPTTLQLPPGSQVLEYRYQGFRQTRTHLISSQETSTANITFPIKVQINARPWAQVFLDGARLTPIGQTPLGDVSVPIGGVLVFQNPGFPDKRYRVTAKDAEIQIAFP